MCNETHFQLEQTGQSFWLAFSGAVALWVACLLGIVCVVLIFFVTSNRGSRTAKVVDYNKQPYTFGSKMQYETNTAV